MRNRYHLYGALLFFVTVMAGCTGTQTFGTAARPGDTVALGLGWNQELSRQNLIVTITAADGASYIYNPGDPAVRAIINNYPDPVSNLVVGSQTGQNIVGNETIWGTLIDGSVTGGDKDWSQTVVFLDLPVGMATGIATVDISTPGGLAIAPIAVEILAGSGSAHTFTNREGLTISPAHLKSLERASHNTITFQGSTVPYAIQLDIVHDPDVDRGGVGRAYVVNTRGDIKNVSWTDDGTNLRVILLPANNQTPSDLLHFKFYVAGGITGLQNPVVQAFDSNGGVLVSGVTATIQ